jgi:cell division septal protein FtsQ
MFRRRVRAVAQPMVFETPLQRRLRWRRRMVRLGMALSVLAVAAGSALPVIEAQPVFRVRTIRLVGCPDTLRTPIAKLLSPLLGHTLFEVRDQAPRYLAQVRALPEVKNAALVSRPPNLCEVRITPRVARYAVRAGERCLAVDVEGRILRHDPRPGKGLPEVWGLAVTDDQPGRTIPSASLQPVETCLAACEATLGAPPAAVELCDGGALRVRTQRGDRIVLGRLAGLENKLRAYLAVRSQLTDPLGYIDVSTPGAPVVSGG